SKEECQELFVALEKQKATNVNNDSGSQLLVDDREEKSESEEENEEESTNKKQNEVIVIDHVDNSNTKNKTTVSNESPSQKNKRPLPLTNKDSNTNDENSSVSKRLKSEDDADEYIHARMMVLQEKNEKLKKQITEMENNWMPRPDPVTINYFAKIVSICTGEEKDRNDNKSDQLTNIMATLALSESELDECTDSKRYGRLMHPAESLKFTDGELNNAMGSDFYQRDRGLKQQNEEPMKNTDHDTDSSEDDY
ncbi:unnamed protein product, partial [Rotaria sp. Silwood1]